MMKNILYFVCFSLLMCVQSCSYNTEQQKTPLQQLEELAYELNGSDIESYSHEEIEQKYDMYLSILDQINYDQLSNEERRELGRLEGECAAFFAMYTIDEYKKSFKSVANEIGGIVEGVLNVINGL